jgi:voltage-gated potassium channel
MADAGSDSRKRAAWRDIWNKILFGHETLAGRLFDILLLTLILLSVVTVFLESVQSIRKGYGGYLQAAEWLFTAIFTLEYATRIICVPGGERYTRSFLGVVDLLAVAPVYLSLLFAVAPSFTVVRSLRLFRIFRILRLTEYLGEAATMRMAIAESLRKVTLFLFMVLAIVVIAGAIMFQIEGEANGFTSIPAGIYWAIVTVTTVGYGDIAPKTFVGRILASILMIVGYGIIAVPTGIVSFELARTSPVSRVVICSHCDLRSHDPDARQLQACGAELVAS